MAGSFNSMRSGGNSSMGGGSFRGRTGGRIGGKNRNSGQSVNNSVGGVGGDTVGQGKFFGETDRFRAQSPWHSTSKSPWSGWGSNFREAIFGKNKKEDNIAETPLSRSKRDLPKGILDMQIKINPESPEGKVEYDYRKNRVSIGGEKGIDKRKLPKDLIRLAKGSRGFRKVTGLGTVTDRDRSRLKSVLRHQDIKIKRANRRLLSSATKRSRSGSSNRKIIFGDLIK